MTSLLWRFARTSILAFCSVLRFLLSLHSSVQHGDTGWLTNFGVFFLLFLRRRGTVSVLTGAVHFNVLDEVSVMSHSGAD